MKRNLIRRLLGELLLVASLLTTNAFASGIAAYESALIEANFDEKITLIDTWYQDDSDPALAFAKALREGQVYVHKREQQLYLIEDHATGKSATRIRDQSSVIIEKKRDFKRLSINNSVRSYVDQLVASAGLTAKDAERRLTAVKGMLESSDIGAIDAIRAQQAKESDARVAELLKQLIAIDDLQRCQSDQCLQAIDTLGDSLYPASLNALHQFTDNATDPTLIKTSQRAISGIEASLRWMDWAQTLYFGLSLGSVLVLAGIGLAITFGVMGVINMAHGELIMLGAYTTYVVQQWMPNHIGLSILVAIPAAFLVSAAVGMLIERGVIRFLYGRPLETLLATFGVSLILQQAVRSIFSPLNRSVETPTWMAGQIEINPVLALTTSRLYIIVFALLVFVALLQILKRTSLGLQVRAVAQNRAMARSMGVRSEWVDALTFGLGSGVAGLAGVALSQLTNVGPNLGQAYIIDSFMVVVFGGAGNLWGTLVAGMSLGVVNKLLEPSTGAVLAKIIVLIFIILFIQKRPRGLFPQRGRAAEA